MVSNRQNTILVSACLLGLDTRYNGLCKKNDSVVDFLSSAEWTIIPVCPEQLAGLPTPRPATQFAHGDGDSVLAGAGSVINSARENMDKLFIKGANQVLTIAQMNHCTRAILKERSPSCGLHQICREDRMVEGHGVTTALLKNHGITIFNEDEIDMIDKTFTTEEK